MSAPDFHGEGGEVPTDAPGVERVADVSPRLQPTPAPPVSPVSTGLGLYRGAWKRIALGVFLAAAALLALEWKPALQVVREVRATSHVRRVESLSDSIGVAAREAGVDPFLLAGMLLSESGGRVDAVSRADALGLMQLMLPTAREWAGRLGLEEPTRDELLSDGALSLKIGAHYVAWLIDRYGDLERVLAAYNAGPGKVDRWSRRPGGFQAWASERRAADDSYVLRYVDKVLLWRDHFRERGVIQPVEEFAPHRSLEVEPIPRPLEE